MIANPFIVDSSINSSESVQQGDPLVPLLFCLGIRKICNSLSSELNLWYLDDDTVAGDPSTVLQDFQFIIEEAAKIGLQVNGGKCEIISLTDDHLMSLDIHQRFSELAPGIKLLEKHEAQLLGTALFPEGVDCVFEHKVEQLRRLVDRLSAIDSHNAFYLLKNCFGLPKLLYKLRTALCFKSNVLPLYNSILKQGLELISMIYTGFKHLYQ